MNLTGLLSCTTDKGLTKVLDLVQLEILKRNSDRRDSMGKKYTTRHKARRKLEGAANLCDNINQHLADLAKMYESNPKFILDILIEAGRAVESLREMFLKLREEI